MAAAATKAPMLGKQAKADLPSAVFGEELHESLVHEAARADLAARRRGTASTLGRGEVAMTTAKAWRQKGTGRARAGRAERPASPGGGVAFGPKPRGYAVKVNRKARRRALRAALSVHAARGSVAVLDGAASTSRRPSGPPRRSRSGAPSARPWSSSIARRSRRRRAFATSPRSTVMQAGDVGGGGPDRPRLARGLQSALETLEPGSRRESRRPTTTPAPTRSR